MASFTFGFQLGGSEESSAPDSASVSSSSVTAVADAAPPSFTAAAPDTPGQPPPPAVVVPLDAPGPSPGVSAVAGAADTREVPIGVGPPMRVTERVHGVMENVPEGVDLIPGVYEGGLKVWESSVDLVRFMREQQAASNLALGPVQSVLELGCGHGLPGVHALQQGARVCFMDLNAEVLTNVTRPNIALNNCGGPTDRALLVSGDWADASRVLRQHWAAGEEEEGGPFFDLILSAETFYTADVTDKLLAAIQRHLQREGGAEALVAGKRFYFGTHGSVADLVARAERAGLVASVLASVEDGRSNIRDIVRVAWR